MLSDFWIPREPELHDEVRHDAVKARVVNHAEEALAAARCRATTYGTDNVSFVSADVRRLELNQPMDAVISRFVLMHQTDPVDWLRTAGRHVRPGGLVACLESQMRASIGGVHSAPHSPMYDRILGLQLRVMEAVGVHTDLGLRLPSVFEAAGLPQPNIRLQAHAEAGPNGILIPFVAESLRSMLPMIERYRIETLTEADVDALEVELRREVAEAGGTLVSPLVVGAWCQMPTASS